MAFEGVLYGTWCIVSGSYTDLATSKSECFCNTSRIVDQKVVDISGTSVSYTYRCQWLACQSVTPGDTASEVESVCYCDQQNVTSVLGVNQYETVVS